MVQLSQMFVRLFRGHGSHYVCAAWLVLFAALALQTEGLIVSTKKVHSERLVTTFEAFALGSDGVVTIQAFAAAEGSYSSSDLYSRVRIMVCPERRYNWLVSDPKSSVFVCSAPNGPSVEDCFVINLNTTKQEIKTNTLSYYRFSVINCLTDSEYNDGRMASVTVYASYVAMNGNSQLGVGSDRLPTVFLAVSSAWGGLTLIWGVYSAWRWRLRNALHRAMWIAMWLKLAVSVVAVVYWHVYASQGVRADLLLQMRSFFFATSEAAVFATFMLIAKGWLITRHTLPAGEIRTAALALVLLLGSLLFLSFYSDEYYYMAMLIMYFFMLPKIFSALTRNTRILQSERWMLEQLGDRQNRPAEVAEMLRHVRDKYTLFQRLRRVVGAYLVFLLLINSMRLVSYWEFDWLLSLLNEINSFLVVALVSFFIRPQRSGVFAVLANRNPFLFDWRRLLQEAGIALGDEHLMDNLPQVNPWDVTKSFIIEWPRSDPTVPSPELALAVESKYDSENMEPVQGSL